ncbi:MAG: hypothetical protein IKT86_01345 [Bacteroidaceae bacterium]|nr:hypothetical protein [Bacteroidaceae bacterium]
MKKKMLTILGCILMAMNVLAENTKTISVTFEDFTPGNQYANNEEHDLGEGLIIYTTECHFTEELRIYSSTTHNGFVISASLSGPITQMTFNAAYEKRGDILEVYGSTNNENWTLVKNVNVDYPSWWDYTVSFQNHNFTRFKLDVKGDNQIRIKSMSITYISDDSNDEENNEGGEEPDDNPDTSEPVEPSEPTEPSVPNDGTKEKPYTPAEVAEMGWFTKPMTNKWVKGRIYGTCKNTASNITTSNFTSNENIVIGDADAHVPIQLPTGSQVREQINLKDFPYLRGKQLLIKGNLDNYYSVPGMISPTEYEITHEIPINSHGYASLYLDMPAKVPTGSTAYYCTTEGDMAYLTPIGDIVPDSVGVIITSTPNTTCILTYTTASNDKEETIRSTNQLIGFAEETIIPTDSYTYYALNAKNGEVGFYIPQTTTEEGFTAKANKAYLQVPTEQNVSAFVIHRENDETEIAHITHISEDIIYDLQGRAVTQPTPGIYIRGGRKIIIQ